ncbi:hypothetical protein [Streptomyces sp. NPDC057301]|uniref:hypothetical protein n=1 Tax=Streptomyces sp. NPDC057301 TaxID=3346093 RepID=UPI00362ECC2F
MPASDRTSAPDRLAALLVQDKVTGIDFVHVHPSQTVLDVYFLRDPGTLAPPLPGALPPKAVSVYDTDRRTLVPVKVVSPWPQVQGRTVLRLTFPQPGRFGPHRLTLDGPRIDPFHNSTVFSFKAACRTTLDCDPPHAAAPPSADGDFPVDYLARDFASLRRALLDFAARRHPDWQDRLEADVGVMWAELAAAVGDDLAYTQDRWAREAFWSTAVLRRSVRGHARLIDHDLDDGESSTVWLDVTVAPGPAAKVTVNAGTVVTSADGGAVFEVGRGLHDPQPGYDVHRARNEFRPHVWDKDAVCLPCGATSLHLVGKHAKTLAFDDLPDGRVAGTWLLLQHTPPAGSALPARAWPVRVVAAADAHDPVLAMNVTAIQWEPAQATPYELDLTTLTVRGNLIPATAGESRTADFRVGPATVGGTDVAPALDDRTVERAGPGGGVCHRFTLPGSDRRQLAWLPAGVGLRPEVLLQELDDDGTPRDQPLWVWKHSLLGVNSSLPDSTDFTLEDGTWQRVAAYRLPGGEVIHRDFASGQGVTVRFGDGEFAQVPRDGTRFRATYRLCHGRRDDIAAGTLVTFPKGVPGVESVTNPVPARGGRDPQSLTEVRIEAPDAFRAVALRAVRPEDYAEVVERLTWVQRAGAVVRWTGSWPTVFATADPRGAAELTETQRDEVARQLDRFRQAGREAHARPPRYADLDLAIRVCVAPDAYPGQVEAAVLQALLGRPGACGERRRGGFFDPDHLTFGTPLFRSRLEAAVQQVPGVRAVRGLRLRRRGRFDWRDFTELEFRVALDEVIRVEQDTTRPERGSVHIITEGGA